MKRPSRRCGIWFCDARIVEVSSGSGRENRESEGLGQMKKYRIEGGTVFTDRNCFAEEPVYIADEKIVGRETYEKAVGEEERIDARGQYVIPGLTDIHFHGCVGSDCCDGTPEAFEKMAEYEGRQGVTTITPATMTMPEEVLERVAKAAVSCDTENGAVLCGLYMEGPFISPGKKGAQNEAYIRKPDVDLFRRLQAASGGMFRTVVVAPETEGALDFIRSVFREVNVSLGHTMADYELAREAMECGASELTHLYNAMMPFTHRSPGPMAAAADDATCRVEMICDGVHLHPATVRTTFRIFGDDRILLISDSMRAAGLEDGTYELGGQKVIVKGKTALLEDGTIAGSVTSLMGCVRTAVKEMGIPLESALKCAAVNPAKAIGIYDRYGSLTPGKYANVVLLDKELQVKRVLRHGRDL